MREGATIDSLGATDRLSPSGDEVEALGSAELDRIVDMLAPLVDELTSSSAEQDLIALLERIHEMLAPPR